MTWMTRLAHMEALVVLMINLKHEEPVELVNVSGNDLTVVNSARVSFGKRKTELDDKDVSLINYLAKNKHLSPFRHAHATFCITCPIFVARQIHKHQVGFTVNEISGRYVEFDGDAWEPDRWRTQSASVKQGSDGQLDEARELIADALYVEAIHTAYRNYKKLIGLGVCKEQARAVLPVGQLTSFFMTGSLQAWAHFYQLRSDGHAQYETREYARLISKHLSQAFPHSWAALTKGEA